jgi:transcriptional regulator with XRE-family HTH domain
VCFMLTLCKSCIRRNTCDVPTIQTISSCIHRNLLFGNARHAIIPAFIGIVMQLPVQTVADLGLALRATRRSGKVRLDDLAQIAGVSKQFVSDVEYGKQTVQLGLVLKLLSEMGVSMSLDIPHEAQEEWEALLAKGGLPGHQQRKKPEADPTYPSSPANK